MFPPVQFVGIFLLSAVFVWQIVGRRHADNIIRGVRIIFLCAVIIVSLALILYSYDQFFIWRTNEIGKFFLPPYRTAGYFFLYVLTKYWSQFLISAAISVLFFFAARTLNRKRGGQIFHSEEPLIIALSIFLMGHPLWIAYLFLVAALYLAASVVFNLWFYARNRLRQTVGTLWPRFSFYYGWIPFAILFILFKGVLIATHLLSSLAIASAYSIL